MKHHIFVESDKYSTALLIKSTNFNKRDIEQYYVALMNQYGVSSDQLIAFTLQYDEDGKASATYMKDYLVELLSALQSLGIDHLFVTDSAYFKTLTKQSKTEPHYGYVLPCSIKGYTHMKVVLSLSYQALVYKPTLQDKLDLSVKVLSESLSGNYIAPGSNAIDSAHYPNTVAGISAALQDLHQYPVLSCDIEAFSLRFNEAGIASIAFAWDKHNGTAFLCDYSITNQEDLHGVNVENSEVRKLLFIFFSAYRGTLVWHKSSYDLKVIIYTLWMKDLLDTAGLLDGLKVMTRSFEDTKIIAYLATNTTAGNVLGLKALAQEFAGNWAQDDIKDIRKIPAPQLLQYNLIDALSTLYVQEKYYPVLVQDKQEAIYREMMLPSLKTIIQMELTGMPLNADRVQEVKQELTQLQEIYLATLTNNPVIQMVNVLVQTKAMVTANAKLKTKQHPLEKFSDVVFNPNSGPQLQTLLYTQMGLPVLDLTDTKQPATGAETLEKLLNHASTPEYKSILSALIGLAKVGKILSSFIPAFEKAIKKGDNWVYLHGNFNLGGTVSGRLSSSEPNLQNIPANSVYGKLIKSCFQAPKGWLFTGADFNSLEDMISALTTKDKNKLKVYTDGYCGHCLRAFSYFPDEMPGIVDTVASINSIKKLFHEQRQNSKQPTFLLTYGGTYHGMMSNLGWEKEKAQAIEKSYHDLYKESDDYVQARLQQASKDGYVEVAFGLRVRTPLLKQVMFGSKFVPYEAQAEGRTAGNALGQSYGLLNNRAANAFMQLVWDSPYRLDIKPVALIHDAIYLQVRDDVAVVEWVNNTLIGEMQWQNLPEIQHPVVKLGANLDIYWPAWDNAITLPNQASQMDIQYLCSEAKKQKTKPS